MVLTRMGIEGIIAGALWRNLKAPGQEPYAALPLAEREQWLQSARFIVRALEEEGFQIVEEEGFQVVRGREGAPEPSCRSYVTNCFIRPRAGETLFHASEAGFLATLDGYTIVPTEEYGKQLPMKPLTLRAETEEPSRGHQVSNWRKTSELEGEIAELKKTVAAYEVLYPRLLSALNERAAKDGVR